MQSTSWETLGWNQVGIKIAGRNINNLRYADGETVETVADFIFWAPKALQMVTAAMKLKDAYSLEGTLWPA